MIALLAAVVLGVGPLDGVPVVLLVRAAAAYLLCVQVPTFVVDVPMNTRLQAMDLDAQAPASLRATRQAFEGRWTYWNAFRTVFACISTGALLMLLVAL